MKSDLKQAVLDLVHQEPGRKASAMVTMLKRLGFDVERRDVNSVLYKLQNEGKTKKNDDHTWHTVRVPAQTSRRGKNSELHNQKPSSGGTNTKQPPATTPPPLPESITLTDEQQRIVSIAPTGHTLIRGEPGSGKTTVLAHRAKEFAAKESSGRLLMLTYNTALASYTRRLLAGMGSGEEADIMTLHQWALQASKDLTGEPLKWVQSNATINNMIQAAIEAAKAEHGDHRLLQLNKSFWDEEISWIYGQGIGSKEKYREVARTGRGTAVQIRSDDRDVAWAVFHGVHTKLKEAGYVHMDYAVGPILKGIRELGGIRVGMKYEHVFIDEVQDFHPSWLFMMSQIATTSLTLAGDLGQRIYRRNFTWKSVGINVVGRSHALKGSFRTTREIMNVAIKLLENMELAKDPDWVPPSLPNRTGPKVQVAIRQSETDVYKEVANRCAGILRRTPSASIVVAHHFNKQLDRIVDVVCQSVPRTKKAKGNELGEMPPGVVVTTYFQLKGLEFDHVILLGLENKLMPNWWVSVRDESETEEETQAYLRRLVYVAMTRAKNSVHLMGVRDISSFFNDVPRPYLEISH